MSKIHSLRTLPLLLLAVFFLPLFRFSKAQCPNLLWSDEFDGSALNTTDWTPMVGDGCDLGICGWGNNEWEYYESETNFEVSDGTLKIIARYDSTTQQYTSARLRSLGKQDFDLRKPVRIEARIKVPQNSQGLWPAFWMLPSNIPLDSWPVGGEIDIMEFIGREPNHTYGVIHYGKLWNDKSYRGSYMKYPGHVGDDFRVFSIDKYPDKITYSVDGYRFQAYTKGRYWSRRQDLYSCFSFESHVSN